MKSISLAVLIAAPIAAQGETHRCLTVSDFDTFLGVIEENVALSTFKGTRRYITMRDGTRHEYAFVRLARTEGYQELWCHVASTRSGGA